MNRFVSDGDHGRVTAVSAGHCGLGVREVAPGTARPARQRCVVGSLWGGLPIADRQAGL